MVGRTLEARKAEVIETAATLGAAIVERDEANEWGITVAGKHLGHIRYEPRARVWLATTGPESTVGDLADCLRFVIRRY